MKKKIPIKSSFSGYYGMAEIEGTEEEIEAVEKELSK